MEAYGGSNTSALSPFVSEKFSSKKFTSEDRSWGFADFFSEKIMNVIKPYMLTTTETLRIECNLTIEKAEFSIPPIGDYEAPELLDDLQNLLTNSIISDFTILCRNQAFPCHKAILVSRSSVFRRMLEKQNTSTEKKVEIIHFDPETLKDFLQFLYTGQVKNENQDQSSYNSVDFGR